MNVFSPWRRIAGLGAAVLLAAAFPAGPLQAQESAPPTDPTILSVHPLGARAGSALEVDVQGYLLEGARAVWFEQGGIQSRVRDVRAVPAEGNGDSEAAGEDKPVLLGVRVELEIPSNALAGVHRFRLVSKRGVSNALMFWVNSDAVLDETSQPHQTPSTAQPVGVPAVVNGRVVGDGEEDFYAFELTEARELRFEVFCKTPGKPPDDVGLDPELTLYEPTGSWFDKERTTRLAYNDDPSSYHVSRLPRLTYRFRKEGRYLVGVGAFLGGGSPHFSYQLRISDSSAPTFAELDRNGYNRVPVPWKERAFRRPIGSGRLALLESRSVVSNGTGADRPLTNGAASSHGEPVQPGANGRGSQASIILVKEQESGDGEGNTLSVSVPGIAEGTIDRPGDVDRYAFKAERGQQVAFEVETPQVGPPQFNPRFGVLDEEGRELFNNVYKRLGRQLTFYLKTVEPKTLYTFERSGEYSLVIGDLTRRFGNAGFRYRLLLRPQIPHVGEVRTDTDRLNLVAGQASKITVTTDQEEGYSGDIALVLDGLPEGVEFYPGTEVKAYQGPVPEDGLKTRFSPRSESVTIVLLAGADAPATPLPVKLRLLARPISDEGPGSGLLIKEIPTMVVRPSGGEKES
ncbi:MAG: hypothetical protein OXG96_14325 [Acidobacteria bacterium]|nr:hypothetical protein [Acidobacteriota bacterium]